ncbi:MAG: anaerobic ribonucleoside-triphosphate reductase [Bilophila wadsworthia]
MVIRNVLLATEAGLGNGDAHLPHPYLHVKGVNFRKVSPTRSVQACPPRVANARSRTFFIDAPFNLAYYKPGHPETEIAYMGCRTRVMANMNDPSEIVNGRGN